MKVSAQYARDHFDEILSAIDNGEEVEVSREGKPSIKLLRRPSSNQSSAEPIILGADRGELLRSTDEEWRQMKEEDARLLDAPLIPPASYESFPSRSRSTLGYL